LFPSAPSCETIRAKARAWNARRSPWESESVQKARNLQKRDGAYFECLVEAAKVAINPPLWEEKQVIEYILTLADRAGEQRFGKKCLVPLFKIVKLQKIGE
jgi:hypothetical protein